MMSTSNQQNIKWLHRWRNKCPELHHDIEVYDKVVAAFREAEVLYFSRRHEVLVMESLIMKKNLEGRYPGLQQDTAHPRYLPNNHTSDNDAAKAAILRED
jgi:hypothetical protein